jgi:hypothetical protein
MRGVLRRPTTPLTSSACGSGHVEESTSFTDRGRALRLIVEEVVYARGRRSGPRLITSCRYIRPYTGSKPITADGLGIVPLGMLPEQEQEAIRAGLVGRAHRYMDICAMPFSVMDYDGPLCLVNPRAIPNTAEEMIWSSTKGAVQVLLSVHGSGLDAHCDDR